MADNQTPKKNPVNVAALQLALYQLPGLTHDVVSRMSSQECGMWLMSLRGATGKSVQQARLGLRNRAKRVEDLQRLTEAHRFIKG